MQQGRHCAPKPRAVGQTASGRATDASYRRYGTDGDGDETTVKRPPSAHSLGTTETRPGWDFMTGLNCGFKVGSNHSS